MAEDAKAAEKRRLAEALRANLRRRKKARPEAERNKDAVVPLSEPAADRG